MSKKYKLTDNGNDWHVMFQFEKHLADRLLDRQFPPEEFSKIITRICKNHICELIFIGEKYGRKRINIYGDDDYMFGCSVSKSANGNFYIKISTLYKERNSKHRKRIIENFEIRTGADK